MKIKVGELRKIIREVAGGAQLPADGDTFVWVDDYTKKINFSDIVGGGDLATATWDDLGDYDHNGPEPGQPGVWFVEGSGTGSQFKPGELVRVPEYDDAGSAWATKKSLPDLEAAKVQAAPKNDVDKAMLKMLSNITTGGVDMTDIGGFSIRLRKGSILFNFDPDDGRGITGSILPADCRGALSSLGLPGVAEWLMSHGASKIKPQKRSPMLPYYD